MGLRKSVAAPLIFVPGILGSQLFKEGTGEPVWPPAGWWDSGHFKPKSLRSIIKVESRETSLNEPLFPLVYSELMRYFENMGYILGRNFWIFAYDWTQSNRKSGQKLAAFIKKIMEPGWDCVDIVNHSMGGLVTRAAGTLYHAHIRRTVYIASPHYGSPKAFFILHPESKFAIFGNFFKSIIGEVTWNWYIRRMPVSGLSDLEKEVKWLSLQMDSMFELLPDRYYLDKHSPVIIKNLSKNTPVFGVEDIYYNGVSRFPSPKLRQKVKAAMAFKDELGPFLPGQQNLLIYSDSEETMDQVSYHEHLPWHFGRYHDSGQKGDWLVPTDSATLNGGALIKRVSGSHNGIPNKEETGKLIKKFLSGC